MLLINLVLFFFLVDNNECSKSNGGCFYFCVNLRFFYCCGCLDGYVFYLDKKMCYLGNNNDIIFFMRSLNLEESLGGFFYL